MRRGSTEAETASGADAVVAVRPESVTVSGGSDVEPADTGIFKVEDSLVGDAAP